MDDIFHFTVVEEIEMAVRIGLAALLGGALGFERRQAEKPAGVQTLALVSGFGYRFGDPSRIAA